MNNQTAHGRRLHRFLLATVALVSTTLPLALTNFTASGKQTNSVSPRVVSAQENPLGPERWSSNGPYGADVTALVMDPNNPAILYAGIHGGDIFKSTNGGESWRIVRTSPNPYSAVQALAIDPTNSSTLYCSRGGAGGEISKSTDRGETWQILNNLIMSALVVDPSNPNIVYGAGHGVFKSTDGGLGWTDIGAQQGITSDTSLLVLALDPLNPNIVYAAGATPTHDVVFKSSNGGQSWTTSFLNDDHAVVRSLAIDPTNPNIIYAATRSGVYKSTDGASTWTTFNSGLTYLAVNAIAIDPHNPATLYAGVFGVGVFKSINGGSWSAAYTGLSGAYIIITALVIDPINPAIIYVGTFGGVFKTTDAAGTWEPANSGLRGISIDLLAVNPGNTNVYALIENFDIGGNDTYYSRTNGGGWVVNDFYPLAFDHQNSNTIYAHRYGRDELFKSTDGGASWINTGLSDVNGLAIDPNNSDVIYAATDHGFYKTINAGGSWTSLGSLSAFPRSLVIDPTRPNIIYALAISYNTAVYKSTDSGMTWSGPSLEHVQGLAIDPFNTETVYAWRDYFGDVYKSTDSGGTWTRLSGLPDTLGGVTTLVVDPVHPNLIYAGNFREGVFRSADGGATWGPFNYGLTNLKVNALAIDSSGNFLHAATTAGVFDYHLNTTPVQFNATSYSANEAAGQIVITIDRSGDRSDTSTVSFATSDSAALNNCDVINGVASARCDYTTVVGSVNFAAGQDSKTISIPLVDDTFAEGSESFTISLTNASGASIGSRATATITIQDNDATNGANPIEGTAFFVRQQYLDFLNREPDPVGSAAWQTVINGCMAGDTTCDRIHVSSSFFRSPEFQVRGYFVYRFYPVSFGRKPDYDEFTPDLAKVSGFLSDAELEAAKLAFVNDFMNRPAFITKFSGLTNDQYVDTLLSTAGITHPARDFWIASLNIGNRSRGQVLREISESVEVYNKYYNQAFVVMQYFGYLRRQPDAQYLNWIQVLDSGGDSRGMINGFMNSVEYRARFGP